MKKLLLPFILLFTIPFNSSCIREITFDVVVVGENCIWDEPTQKATMGRTYTIKLTPKEGYYLGLLEGIINVETENSGDITKFLKDDLYNQETDILTIPSNYVTSKITITANAQEDDPGE